MGGLISNLFLFYGTALAYGRPILEIPFAGRFFCSSLRGVETTIRLTRPVRPCPLLLETQRPFTTGKLTRSDVSKFHWLDHRALILKILRSKALILEFWGYPPTPRGGLGLSHFSYKKIDFLAF